MRTKKLTCANIFKYETDSGRVYKTDAIELRISIILINILLWDEDISSADRSELMQALERLNKIASGKYPFANITLRGNGLKHVIVTLLIDVIDRCRNSGFLKTETELALNHVEKTIDDEYYEPRYELADGLVEAAKTIEHYFSLS